MKALSKAGVLIEPPATVVQCALESANGLRDLMKQMSFRQSMDWQR